VRWRLVEQGSPCIARTIDRGDRNHKQWSRAAGAGLRWTDSDEAWLGALDAPPRSDELTLLSNGSSGK
jgi:hypothetical protein